MTENDKNIRTLIVCFVMAIMVLIPLRMVEVGQTFNQVKVLGETEEFVVDREEMVIEELDEGFVEGDESVLENTEGVVLPNAELE